MNRGPGRFSKTLQGYSLGEVGKPQSLQDGKSSPTSTESQVHLLSYFFTLKVTKDTASFGHPQAGMPWQPQPASQKSEDLWAWHCRIYTGRLPFSKLLPILFHFKQQTRVWCSIFWFENAPAEYLHGYHGSYQVASSCAWSWDCQQESQYSSILFLPGLIF